MYIDPIYFLTTGTIMFDDGLKPIESSFEEGL